MYPKHLAPPLETDLDPFEILLIKSVGSRRSSGSSHTVNCLIIVLHSTTGGRLAAPTTTSPGLTTTSPAAQNDKTIPRSPS